MLATTPSAIHDRVGRDLWKRISMGKAAITWLPMVAFSLQAPWPLLRHHLSIFQLRTVDTTDIPRKPPLVFSPMTW